MLSSTSCLHQQQVQALHPSGTVCGLHLHSLTYVHCLERKEGLFATVVSKLGARWFPLKVWILTVSLTAISKPFLLYCCPCCLQG